MGIAIKSVPLDSQARRIRAEAARQGRRGSACDSHWTR